MFSRPVPVPSAAPPRPYTVSELLAEVSTVLRTSWRDVAVVGEIGRFDLRGGHGYFTLKDASAALPAIIFASDLKRIPFRLEPGLEVVVRGSLDLYAPQGKFQIKAYAIEPVGRGALQLAFEQLKAKLEAEGLFAAARKRPIPKLPRTIAVVTSPTGAVVRDILHVLSRRYDGLGDHDLPGPRPGRARRGGDRGGDPAVQSPRRFRRPDRRPRRRLARGPRALQRRGGRARARRLDDPDDLGRRATRPTGRSADLVADLRAPTPSAAAELVVERKDEIARRRRPRPDAGAVGDAVRGSRSSGRASRGSGAPTRSPGSRGALARARASASRRDARPSSSCLERRPAEYAARLAAARRTLADFPRVAELARRRDAVGGRPGDARRADRAAGASGGGRACPRSGRASRL